MFEVENKELYYGDYVIVIQEASGQDKEVIRWVLTKNKEHADDLEQIHKDNKLIMNVLKNNIVSVRKGDEEITEITMEIVDRLYSRLGGHISEVIIELLVLGQITEDDKKK